MINQIFNTLLYTEFALGVVVLLGFTLHWTYIWQNRDYRWDRMRDFLSSYTGRRLVIWPAIIVPLLLILLVLITSIIARLLVDHLLADVLVVGAGVLGLLGALIYYIRLRLRPEWTLRARLVALGTILLTVVGVILLFTFGIQSIIGVIDASPSVPASGVAAFAFLVFQILLIALLALLPIWSALVSWMTWPLVRYQKKRLFAAARVKLDRIQPIVVGITGSYGKSTTKHFLYQLLSQRFSVLTTPKNVNVDIGIARTIIQNMNDDHQIFVAEMGAYIYGEIASSAALAEPVIGIITAIEPQHLALFGSIERIMDAKSELIKALPSSGLAILNGDNERCNAVADRTQAQIKRYSIQGVASVYATDIQPQVDQVTFRLHIGNESRMASTPLFGAQVVPSILAAATAASHLGLSIDEIVTGIGTLSAYPGTMHTVYGRNHATVIDDGYNANPDGFIAALDYLDLFEDKRKVVITDYMRELGETSDGYHRSVGKRIGEVADEFIICKKDFAEQWIDGALDGGLAEDRIVVMDSVDQLIRDHLSQLTPNDVILIEGRVNTKIARYILNQ